jgi:hypothetical protein
MSPPSGSGGEDPAVELSPESDGADSFFGWYHHALALAYSVSAAVSAGSMPLGRLARYFVASLVGAYVGGGVLTVVQRRLIPRVICVRAVRGLSPTGRSGTVLAT